MPAGPSFDIGASLTAHPGPVAATSTPASSLICSAMPSQPKYPSKRSLDALQVDKPADAAGAVFLSLHDLRHGVLMAD